MESNNQFWNRYASEFDAIYGTRNTLFNNLINRLFRNSMKLRFDKSMEIIPDDKVSVLDIGCGPGHYCVTLAKSGNRMVNGIDFAENMIQIARDHAREMQLEDKIQLEVVDFIEFNPKQKFDFSLMIGFIEYFKDPKSVLEKACEITNQKVLVSFPIDEGLLAFQRKLRYKWRCYLRMYTYNELKILLDQLKVKSYKIERLNRDFFVTIQVN